MVTFFFFTFFVKIFHLHIRLHIQSTIEWSVNGCYPILILSFLNMQTNMQMNVQMNMQKLHIPTEISTKISNTVRQYCTVSYRFIPLVLRFLALEQSKPA